MTTAMSRQGVLVAPIGGTGSGITEITSTGTTVSITDSTGPITNLEVATGYLTSFNARTGPAVVPANGDYTAAEVTNAADKSASTEQVFTGVVGTPGVATEAGTLSNLSGLMSHVAAGTTGTADQNTSGRDIEISIVLATSASSANNAVFMMGPTSGTMQTVWQFLDAAGITSSIHETLNIRIPKGWFAEWTTFNNVSISNTPLYW